MKAMILAAGLGTRLRPLTDDRPKALVEVRGQTMLEIALQRLRACGVNQVIVNTHHYADMVRDYLASQKNFGMRIELSREDILLDTGGGLQKAAWFFLEDGAEAPFLLHNVDVISNIDLARMVDFHREQGALATLAVQPRVTARPLLFGADGCFRGRARREVLTHESNTQALAFCGIHVISTRIFARLNETGAFSIIDSYVRLAAEGEKITAFRADEYYWRDLGRPENIEQATRDLASGVVSLT
jgi:NDP-sugar pyrophosphorylase family protein